ncbi:MAG: hypothetical protein PHX38_07745 [Sulfuricella sp.]|nr:hypothetical protein [Sulfuricella sp.]
MNNHFRLPLAGFFIALVFSLNAFGEEAFSEEAMMIKASELTKLSTAVESAVHYESGRSAGLEGPALLQFATGHDPDLLSRFSGYDVRVLARDGHAAVLICTAGGHRALLEDAGCTASMDRHAWNEGADTPCEFRLNLSVLCAAPAGGIEPTPEAKAIQIPAPTPIARFVEIDKAVWTTGVNMDTKQPESDISGSTVGSRLMLWMRVKGTGEALSKLSAEGKLPIRHKWFRGTITGFRAEGVAKPTDEIEIPAGKRGAVEKLATEVRTQGYFSWRTWSSKEKLARGHWRVTVVYSDNTPVLCAASSGWKPCEYKIEVR